MQDYPAAHSMDTEWFAIDKDGNIGVFDSGENGAVPYSSYRVEVLGDLLLELAKKSKNRILQWNIPAESLAKHINLEELQINSKKKNIPVENITNNSEPRKSQISSKKRIITIPRTDGLLEKTLLYNWLFLLSSDDVISRLEIETLEDNYAVHFLGESCIVYVEYCRVIIVKELIEEGLILAGKEIDNLGDKFSTLFGFFSYDSDYDTAFLYEKVGKPVIPLSLNDLPEDIRDAISQTRFDDFSFNKKTKIQPIEHFPCATWGDDKWWID